MTEQELREFLKLLKAAVKYAESCLRTEQEKNEDRLAKHLEANGVKVTEHKNIEIQITEKGELVSAMYVGEPQCIYCGRMDYHEPICVNGIPSDYPVPDYYINDAMVRREEYFMKHPDARPESWGF